jgi:hypothetical protein
MGIDFCVSCAEISGKGVVDRPEMEDCLGLYGENEYIPKATDFDALPQNPNEKFLDFADPIREMMAGLLNELTLAYLEYKVVPISRSCNSVQDAATTLCSNRAKSNSVDCYIYTGLTEFKENVIPGFNFAEVEARIQSFLRKLLTEEERALIDNRDFIRGMGLAVVYLVNEILDLATRCAMDSEHDSIVPVDIRIPVQRDDEPRGLFWLCKTFWFGFN